MAGVSDLPFRRLIRELAGGKVGLTVSEFVSARAITNSRKRELRGMRFDREESPFCLQLFGGDPEIVAEAAEIGAAFGVDAIEINAGCPVPKMVKKGGGSQLLRDLPRFRKILNSVRSRMDLPLSVKVRTGWSDEEFTLDRTLEIAEGEGVDLFVIHGRTRLQGYGGTADWEAIRRAKIRATIPVVGNGDIRTAQEVLQRLESSGADGVAVGRGAAHNPWIFRDVNDLLSGKQPQLPGGEEQHRVFRRYHELMEEDGASPLARLGRLKLLAARMLRAVPQAEEYRAALLRSDQLSLFFSLLDQFYSASERIGFAPELLENLNGNGV